MTQLDACSLIAPGLGHVWNLEAPALFAAIVCAWTSNAPLPPALQPLH